MSAWLLLSVFSPSSVRSPHELHNTAATGRFEDVAAAPATAAAEDARVEDDEVDEAETVPAPEAAHGIPVPAWRDIRSFLHVNLQLAKLVQSTGHSAAGPGHSEVVTCASER